MRLSLPGRRTAEPAAAPAPAAGSEPAPEPQKPAKAKRPLYTRLLHLRHIAPNAWQRAVLGEGSLALAVVLVLADLATAWTLLVLPLAVAALVKAHDLLARLLGRPAVVPEKPRKPRKPTTTTPTTPPTARTRPPDARTAPAPRGGAAGGRKS